MSSEVNGFLVATHELKAPLNVLRQLAFSIDSNISQSELEYIKSQMIDVSDRAIRQVNDLTKIARLQDGLFTMEPVAIRGVCEEVTSELDSLFRFNHRSLQISYTNHFRLVVANRDLLSSIVYNFCLNAMHYSDQETIAKLTVKDRYDKVRLLVRDFGPALPTDVWRSMKKGWLTQPTSITMRPGSSGLGLFIASKFSEYMSAEIGVIRHRDGTSFYVDLPVSKQMSFAW